MVQTSANRAVARKGNKASLDKSGVGSVPKKLFETGTSSTFTSACRYVMGEYIEMSFGLLSVLEPPFYCSCCGALYRTWFVRRTTLMY